MEIDNSAANEFRTCPLLHQETRLAEGTGLELQPYGNDVTPLDLGSRVHELEEEYYRELQGNPREPYPESPNPALEMEAQVIMAGYKAKYPVEEFEIVDVERTFKVQLPDLCPRCYRGYGAVKMDAYPHVVCKECGHMFGPGRHIYTGKIDVTFRLPGRNLLDIMDHKTEKRRSNSNRPQKWAARDQASLYLWAAQHIYQEPIGNFYVNILKRPSEKFQEPPTFPDRQKLERTPQQIETAVRDIVFIADEIERYKRIFGDGVWPSNREECDNGFYQCDFYLPHTYGWSPEIRERKYQIKTPYLELAGVPIIQP
jgi:hypothetical protein